MTALAARAGVAPSRLGVARFSALVVVGDPLARSSAVRGLQELGASTIAEAGSAGEARIRARSGMARDLVVVDLSLPDGSGLALLTELRAAGWVRGLVLSATEDPYTVRAALTSGVRSFLVRGAPATGSATGTSGLLRGRTMAGGPEGLSAREVEVLQLVADGKTNRDIGVTLGLSALTVKSHLARIARKLGTGDRAEMVVVTLRAGVIS